MGEVLRYGRPRQPEVKLVDGHRNFFWATNVDEAPSFQLEAGINVPARTSAVDGARLPAILISSSPHKVGAVETPWQDVFDVDNGHIRYFGDNKAAGKDPLDARGNAALSAAWATHNATSSEARARAVPVIFFRRVPRLGQAKGFVRFEGFGIVRTCELVVQAGSSESFSNLVFDFVVFDLAEEQEMFDWRWIAARRLPDLSVEQTQAFAPKSWRRWLQGGERALPTVRRLLSRRSLESAESQMPKPGTRLRSLLEKVYDNYKGREAKFEAVAAWAAHRSLGDSYRPYGVTRATGDRGFDFVGRLDLGMGFGAAKLVVLGQAKCEKLDKPTGGQHVARTVARLRRGWLGVYVTTSYFSKSVQLEIVQDRYPLLLIGGLRLAEALDEEVNRRGQPLETILSEVERDYGRLSELSDPDQVLFLEPDRIR